MGPLDLEASKLVSASADCKSSVLEDCSSNTEGSREDISKLFSSIVESSQERPKPLNLVESLGGSTRVIEFSRVLRRST